MLFFFLRAALPRFGSISDEVRMEGMLPLALVNLSVTGALVLALTDPSDMRVNAENVERNLAGLSSHV